MTLIEFEVPYAVGWRGKTYQAGLQSIPEDLAVALGWSPTETEGVSEVEKNSPLTKSPPK
ncbi:MAG: hypothetical protein V7K76_22975 [Nostoc sp.]|uniref:hypothetical protein n=1 Tax=Nostoc sp. TaxID=1180 RepID=UPI002FF58FFC